MHLTNTVEKVMPSFLAIHRSKQGIPRLYSFSLFGPVCSPVTKVIAAGLIAMRLPVGSCTSLSLCVGSLL